MKVTFTCPKANCQFFFSMRQDVKKAGYGARDEKRDEGIRKNII